MKAMWLGLAAIVVIAAAAAVALNVFDWSSAHEFSSPAVRID
jgi:hypothetical protein